MKGRKSFNSRRFRRSFNSRNSRKNRKSRKSRKNRKSRSRKFGSDGTLTYLEKKTKDISDKVMAVLSILAGPVPWTIEDGKIRKWRFVDVKDADGKVIGPRDIGSPIFNQMKGDTKQLTDFIASSLRVTNAVKKSL